MLQIRKLTLKYGPLVALNEISLEIKKGESVCLIGPNRAGKTTLLLAISGVLETSEGRIFFQEEDITNLDPYKIVFKGLGHVAQGRHTFPTLSIRDNLLLGAYIHRRAGGVSRDFDLVFHLFPVLKEREKQRAGTLSGGEQQMLAIGRALMGRPKLLMLDEPSLGIAPLLTKEIFTTLKGMNDQGLTLFIVEQEIELTLTHTHRGYLLRHGRLVREGSSETLMNSQEVRALYSPA